MGSGKQNPGGRGNHPGRLSDPREIKRRRSAATQFYPPGSSEAANFARRFDEPCRKWYDRKAAKTSKVLATKALACKLAKAAWFLAAQETDYDPARVFPELAQKRETVKTK